MAFLFFSLYISILQDIYEIVTMHSYHKNSIYIQFFYVYENFYYVVFKCHSPGKILSFICAGNVPDFVK